MGTGTFGPAYSAQIDGKRINKQHESIKSYMLGLSQFDIWKTLAEIEGDLGFPQASISAQLRHLRKEIFGGFSVDKRRRGNAWEYKVSIPVKMAIQLELFENK